MKPLYSVGVDWFRTVSVFVLISSSSCRRVCWTSTASAGGVSTDDVDDEGMTRGTRTLTMMVVTRTLVMTVVVVVVVLVQVVVVLSSSQHLSALCVFCVLCVVRVFL